VKLVLEGIHRGTGIQGAREVLRGNVAAGRHELAYLREAAYSTISTLMRLVVPGMLIGTPAMMTILSP